MENTWKEFVVKEDGGEELQGKDLTEVIFILDQSGSMWHLKEDTIGGYNSFLAKQKQGEGRVAISTVLFNGRAEVLHDRVLIDKVEPLTEDDYDPEGSTALMDAVGGAVNHISKVHRKLGENRPRKTVCVIITDGYENSSRYYSKREVKKLITKMQEKQGWEFIFLGANIDAAEEAESYGIRRDRAVEYCADEQGTLDNFECMADCMMSIRTCDLGDNSLVDLFDDHLEELRKKNRR